MTYQETLTYLYESQPVFHLVGSAAYKPGLANTKQLLDFLHNPQLKFKTIHVAGTNGKGSVSHLIASVLQKSGYKTGLYTSPHLVDFRERIRINGKMIEKQQVVDFVNDNKQILEKNRPSFFETTMCLAFQYFAQKQVDIAVIEVGLGGRLDSTNVITPELSIITNIGFDHTEFLGNTLEKIATEKAGIIKYKTPVIIGEMHAETELVFRKKAAEMHAEIIFAEKQDVLPFLPCQLRGNYQEKNKKTAYVALKKLQKAGLHISDEAIVDGFGQVCTLTGLQGRWQKLQNHPTVICDTGHNAHGIRYVVNQIKQQNYSKLHIVFGMVNDKDIDQVLLLLPTCAHYYFTQANTKRAIPASDLLQLANNYHLKGAAYKSVVLAYQNALNTAAPNDMIFVGGSNYVVGELLQFLQH